MNIIQLSFGNLKLAAMLHETNFAKFCVLVKSNTLKQSIIRRFKKIKKYLDSSDSGKFSADQGNCSRFSAIEDSVHKIAGTTKLHSLRKEIFEY